MECTQRLECTQELYASQTERLHPEQIGFLGICGTKYPVKKGPNKIGRDPQTCDIVLNLNSISRQHAVINILNGKNFMIMDLDSANKTKLSGKTLQAYIPQPLKNGDMVQFGQVFGVFRLLEEENDLPMTQAVDTPETPIANRHVSRINAPSTTIPESPDVSDRDDSFIKPSQTNDDRLFKSPSNKLIKPSGKTIAIQPIGTNIIDNVFWNSSKKSRSLNLEDSVGGLEDSTFSDKTNNTLLVNEKKIDDIHDMDTQIPFCNNQNHNETADSIYTADTQIPVEVNPSSSIHSLETQLPDSKNIENERDSPLDCYSTNKENDLSLYNAETQLPSDVRNKNNIDLDPDIFEAETQVPIMKNKQCTSAVTQSKCISPNIYDAATQIPTSVEDDKDLIDTQSKAQDKKYIKVTLETNSKSKIDKSDDVIVFDEVDAQFFEDNFDSQPLIPQNSSLNDVNESTQRKIIDNKKESTENIPSKRSVRITSDSSTDCEDFNILPTQKLTEKLLTDDLTDCEDEEPKTQPKKTTHDEEINTQDCFGDDDFDILPTQKHLVNDVNKEEDLTDCEESLEMKCSGSKLNDAEPNFEDPQTQILISKSPNTKNNQAFEDMPTQVLVEDHPEEDPHIEDLPTQVLVDNVSTADSYKESSQQVFSEEIISPFKVPLPTPRKAKKKDTQKRNESISSSKYKDEEDEKYYAATQEIFEDLCSQKAVSPEMVQTLDTGKNKTDAVNSCHISNLDKEILITSHGIKQNGDTAILINEKSSGDEDNADENVTNFVKNLTSKQIREVIGVSTPTSDNKLADLKRMPSDPSDVESTPKKVRSFKLMETDLPNSQEIKTSVSRKSLYTDSSSESELENDTQEENTPILFRPKKRNHKKNAKVDLTRAFEAKALPSRIITRVRKPTPKIQEADAVTKKNNQKILQPPFLTEQEDNIDTEILTENITRLRNKNEKKNKSESSKSDDIKKETTSKTSDVKSKSIEKGKSDHKKERKQKEKSNDEKPKRINEVKSETESKLKEKINEKNSQEKSRQRSKRIYSKEEINDENSKASDVKTTLKGIEAVLPTSSNTKLDHTYKSSRNTRHSNRTKNNNKNEKRSSTPVKETNQRKIKVKVKLKDEEDLSPKKEIRRSKRNRNAMSKNEEPDPDGKPKTKTVNENTEYKPKSILKNSKSVDNQSAVYNISSESGTDSPKNLKRSAMLDMDMPSPKRSRSCRSSNSSSLRSTPARGVQTQFVLFTAFPSEEVKLKLEALGAIVVTDVKDCTVVLTMQIKRTFKLLCAVGLGKPIVGPSWVQACVDNNVIVDPWLYLIKDEASEKRFQFSLERTLSSRRNFLKGYNVSCTPSVMPNAAEMKLIVECSGGTWKAQKPQWICVSCHADKSQWDALREQGAIIVSTEFILSGVLRQRADLKNNRLDVLK